MAWLYIDATFGISGDMMLAGLVDLGLDLEVLSRELSTVIADPFALSSETVQSAGIRSTRLIVECEDHGHSH